MRYNQSDLLFIFQKGVIHGLINGVELADHDAIVEASKEMAEKQFGDALNALKEHNKGTPKPKETEIDFARRLWFQAGKPADGVMYHGQRFMFRADGTYDLNEMWNQNIGKSASGAP